MRTIWWEEGKVILINQKKLPSQLTYIECTHYKRVAKAIKTLEIRGAPAIGIAAAMGLALAAYHTESTKKDHFLKELTRAAKIITSTRPTAQNLFWAANRILHKAYTSTAPVETVKQEVIHEAQRMAEEDIHINKTMGTYGATLLDDGDTIGTICNAGWLATAGEYGTALGVIKVAHEQGKTISTIALETRPVLQGARLTAFELQHDGIDVKIITDGAIGYCCYKGWINKFICGADRIIVSSGCHVINKVGTHTVSITANHYKIPFYVAAPLSTFDPESRLEDVIIEMRNPREITEINGKQIVPEKVLALNPAFDITPPHLIDAIITEKGIIYPPFKQNYKKLLT
jgi:methylthioribose-1-phosphate isomerase